jgi:hypothetical protein
MQSSGLVLTASVLIVWLGSPVVGPHLLFTHSESPHLRHEVTRLRAHFDSVDIELRQHSGFGLTAAQRRSRGTLIGWLREYRNAGRFPINDQFPRRTLPFFRDSRGTLCAMAYLIQRTGRGGLVDRIARARNNAFIPELADNPDLRFWLDSVGLSLAEAARIQPFYEPPPEPSDRNVSAGYALTSIAVSGASLATLGLNLFSPSKPAAWAGVAAGSAALIAGAVKLDGPGDTDQVAAANLIAGLGALTGGLYRLLNPQAARPLERPASRDRVSKVHIALSPFVVPPSGTPRLGLAVRTSF